MLDKESIEEDDLEHNDELENGQESHPAAPRIKPAGGMKGFRCELEQCTLDLPSLGANVVDGLPVVLPHL